jgi:hypothetical protein
LRRIHSFEFLQRPVASAREVKQRGVVIRHIGERYIIPAVPLDADFQPIVVPDKKG